MSSIQANSVPADAPLAHDARAGRRRLVRRGAVVVLVALLAIVTRLTADDAARVLVEEDAHLLPFDRLGPTPNLRAVYTGLDRVTGTIVIDGSVDGPAGVAVSWAPVVAYVEPPATFEGLGSSTLTPRGLFSADERNELQRSFLHVARTGFATASAESLVHTGSTGVEVRWGRRTIPASVVHVDLDSGLVVLLVRYDDGEDEDLEDEVDEEVPFMIASNLAPSIDEDFVITRGHPDGEGSHRGFRYRHADSVGEVRDVTGPVSRADLGAAVGYGFDGGRDPNLIGQLLRTDRRPSFLRTKDITAVLRMVAIGVRDPLPSDPVLGVSTSEAVSWRDGDRRVGVLVEDAVTEETPLRAGDWILSVDGVQIGGGAALRAEVRSRTVGERVQLEVARGDEVVVVNATLQARPSE